LAKSLVLRTHAKGYEIVQLLVDLLQDEKWGSDAAKAFQIITSDDELLNKANHAVIRLLHKQRFFNHVFPKLVTNAASQKDDTSTLIENLTNYSSILLLDRTVEYDRQHPERNSPS
jgi:hypothetical protein